MEKKETIHDMEIKNIKYLVLHRGMMLNEIELIYGEIYSSEMFAKVPEHTIIGMILGGWLYRGTEQEVQRVKNAKCQGLTKFDRLITDQEKEVQIKEVKRSRPAKQA